MQKVKSKKTQDNGEYLANLPQKKEERSLTLSPEIPMDQAPELAKSFTASEARDILNLKLKPICTDSLDTTIQGDDLITHRWSEKALKEMLGAQQMSKEEKKLAKLNRAKKDPQADYEGARYHFDEADWFPANGVKKAMVSAGFGLGIAKSIIQRCIFVSGVKRRDFVEIKYRKLIRREDPVRVGPWNKREADLRYRPEYQDWSADLRIVYRSDIISAEQVLTLLQHAGFSIGIGEWRPEKDGQAGRFTIADGPKTRRV